VLKEVLNHNKKRFLSLDVYMKKRVPNFTPGAYGVHSRMIRFIEAHICIVGAEIFMILSFSSTYSKHLKLCP
jgi:hypothetical protein